MPRQAVLALVLCVACSAPLTLGVTAPESTLLLIENSTQADVVVYLAYSGGKRDRLGLVNANRVKQFRVLQSALHETPSLYIRQIGGREWNSEALHPVLPGDEIRLELSRLGGMYGFLSYR
jgi:hypothetical protein